jgi:hypothetical protein
MSQSSTSRALLSGLNIIYLSLASVMTIFGLVVFYLNYSGSNAVAPDNDFAQILQYVLFGLVPLGIATGYFVFKQQLSSIEPTLTLKRKLIRYQIAILIRSAFLEVPGLFATVAAMITGVNTFLLFTVMIVVIFILLRPTPSSIANDLGLSQSDKNILENPAAKID